MSDAIAQIARNVALARAEEDRLKAIVKEVDETYAISTANMREQLKKASDAARQAEFDLRIAALKGWETDQNKHQPGVTIRMMKRILYEIPQAVAWAKDHHMFLKFDAKAFEKFAGDNPLDFVNLQEEPTAAIDNDLSEFLKDGTALAPQ